MRKKTALPFPTGSWKTVGTGLRRTIGKDMKNYLQNETVVLTGASSGIGREMAKLFVQNYGAKVIGIGRNQEKLESLQKELGEKFTYSVFDVSQKENWQDFANGLKEEPVLLVNNAGAFPKFLKAKDAGTETVERILQNNFLSAVYGIDAIRPLLKKQGGIVNICSSSALCPVVGTSAYSASKSAMKGYTEALMLEEERYVGLFFPGTTKTELFRNDKQTENSALDIIAMPAKKMARKIVKKIVKKRRRAVLGWDAKAMNFVAKIAPVRGLKLSCWVMKISKSKVFENVFR